MTQRGAQMSPREPKDGPKEAKWAARAPKMEPEGTQKRKSGTLKNHEQPLLLLGFWHIGRPGNPPEATTRHQKTPKEHEVTTERHWDVILGTFGGILDPFWAILMHFGRFRVQN